MIAKTFLPCIEFTKIKKLVTLLCLCIAVLCSACAPSIPRLEKKGDVEGLVAILADSTESLVRRADAARSLGNIGSPLAVEALVRALQDFFEQETALFQGYYEYSWNDVDEAVSATADALGQTGDPRAVDPLISVLETISKDPRTYEYHGTNGRDAVARALGTLGDAKALMPLFRSAATACGRGAEDCASWDAVQALGAPTTEMLMEAIAGGRDEDPSQFLFALGILGEETDPRIQTALIETLTEAIPGWRDESSLYEPALVRLSLYTDPRIRGVLEAEFSAPDNAERYQAADALARFLTYDADQLLPYLDSKETVELFYRMLIKIGKPGTEPALISALNKFGDEYTAQDYYECGNDELKSAAYWWIQQSNSKVWVTLGSCGDPCWGEGPY